MLIADADINAASPIFIQIQHFVNVNLDNMIGSGVLPVVFKYNTLLMLIMHSPSVLII